jgi:hypothetical protein
MLRSSARRRTAAATPAVVTTVDTTVENLERRTLLSLAFGSTGSTTDSNLVALPGAVQSADIDGDGNADLVVGVNRAGSTLSLGATDILLSSGSGSFTVKTGPSFPAGSSTSTNAFAVGALAAGGRPDLVYASQQNNGTLTAQITPQINTSSTGSASFTTAASTTIATPTSFNPQQVLIGDFSGDGIPDVAVLGLSAAGESLVILNGNGSGGFTESFNTTITVNTGEQLSDGQIFAGDFNHDGKLDLAVYDPVVGDVTFLMNTSTASTVSFSPTPAPVSLAIAGYASGPVAVGDFNGDGSADLVVGENGANGGADAIVVFLSSGSSSANLTLTPQPAVPAGNPTDDQVGALAVADFNDDGHMDVAEDYGVLLGDGAGGLASPTAAIDDSLLSNTQGFNAVVAASFSGTVLPGVAAVEQANHTVLAVNQTATTPPPTSPAPTTTTLTSSENPASLGDTVTFTATVAATAGDATGYVTFFNGSSELGNAPITNGVATLADSTLPDGDTTVTAKYLGDSSFAASISTALTQSVIATLPSDSSLVPSFAAAKIPPSVVAGAKLNLVVPIALLNSAAVRSTGLTTVQLYAATEPTLELSPLLLASESVKNLPIPADRAALLPLKIGTLPSTLSDGAYYLIAEVTDSTGAATATAAVSTITVAAPFTSITAALTSLRLPVSIVASQRTSAFAVLQLGNVGNVDYVGPVTLSLFASTSQTVPGGATPFRTLRVNRIVLRPSGSASVRVPLGVYPSVSASDDYYIIGQVTDSAGRLSTAASAQTVHIDPVNLAVSATVSASVDSLVANARSAAAATIILTNTGNISAAGTITLQLHASTTGTFRSDDPVVAMHSYKLTIPVGRAAKFKLPIGTLDTLAVGSYYLILQVAGPVSATATAVTPAAITVTA